MKKKYEKTVKKDNKRQKDRIDTKILSTLTDTVFLVFLSSTPFFLSLLKSFS